MYGLGLPRQEVRSLHRSARGRSASGDGSSAASDPDRYIQRPETHHRARMIPIGIPVSGIRNSADAHTSDTRAASCVGLERGTPSVRASGVPADRARELRRPSRV